MEERPFSRQSVAGEEDRLGLIPHEGALAALEEEDALSVIDCSNATPRRLQMPRDHVRGPPQGDRDETK